MRNRAPAILFAIPGEVRTRAPATGDWLGLRPPATGDGRRATGDLQPATGTGDRNTVDGGRSSARARMTRLRAPGRPVVSGAGRWQEAGSPRSSARPDGSRGATPRDPRRSGSRCRRRARARPRGEEALRSAPGAARTASLVAGRDGAAAAGAARRRAAGHGAVSGCGSADRRGRTGQTPSGERAQDFTRGPRAECRSPAPGSQATRSSRGSNRRSSGGGRAGPREPPPRRGEPGKNAGSLAR